MQGNKGEADIKDRLLDTAREGEGGMICESSPETYTLPYVKQTASGNLLYDAGNPMPVLCDNKTGGVARKVGGRFKRRGHMYTYG